MQLQANPEQYRALATDYLEKTTDELFALLNESSAPLSGSDFGDYVLIFLSELAKDVLSSIKLLPKQLRSRRYPKFGTDMTYIYLRRVQFHLCRQSQDFSNLPSEVDQVIALGQYVKRTLSPRMVFPDHRAYLICAAIIVKLGYTSFCTCDNGEC